MCFFTTEHTEITEKKKSKKKKFFLGDLGVLGGEKKLHKLEATQILTNNLTDLFYQHKIVDSK